MSSPKAIFNFLDYKGVLPYASELFGVYQPLLGWKSKRHQRRFEKSYAEDQLQIIDRLSLSYAPLLTFAEPKPGISVPGDNQVKLLTFDPGKLLPEIPGSHSLLVTALQRSFSGSRRVASTEEITDEELVKLLELSSVTKLLQGEVANSINVRIKNALPNKDIRGTLTTGAMNAFTVENGKALMKHEAQLAATLMQMKDDKQFYALRKLLSPPDWKQTRAGLELAATSHRALEQFVPPNPLDSMDPNFDLDRVALSPIGIVHLFRQYFFELDSFLGSPVGHVWLSPGTSLELIEVNTRKVVVEKSFEQSVESIKKSDLSATSQDELADAVKQDNQQNIKFGASVTATYAGVTASSNFDLNRTQNQARETSHKHMRQQSTKLTSELKSNYKTTFKTVTEETNTTSKRYVIQNGSDQLQNYELRRKMRQVAVQVQDVGTYLCWQTFVDKPGDNLDLAKLVHIAQPADLDNIPHPDEPAPLEVKNMPPCVIDFPFENAADSQGNERDVTFYNGSDNETGALDNLDKIIWQRYYQLESAGFDYTIDPASLQISSLHSNICVARISAENTTGKVLVSLEQVNFADQYSVQLQITATWNPPSVDKKAYEAKLLEYDNAVLREQEKAYNNAVKERITLVSKISPRPAEDLREEERIIIYRKLIQEMLLPKGYRNSKETKDMTNIIYETPDTLAARHVLSELINSIFDVDKMLYFVAPEWWKPRLHLHERQSFGPKPLNVNQVGPVSVANQVGWDGYDIGSRKHYYITEDSAPAKLGSSLGWVLQLDGDDLRNAFLNAPWVKTVMPIRPGKEKAAINWLKHMDGFNGIGPTDLYAGEGTDEFGNGLNGKPLVEVLDLLAESVAKKHVEEFTTKAFDLTDPKLPHDPDSTVTATPVDRVWEHGFNPLLGGFQARPLTEKDDPNHSENFQTFDQWVEILPTDQVVPVVVAYDPKTGRLKDPVE